MKNKILFILLLVSSITFSQNFKITKGEIFKDKKKNSALSFSLNDGNGGLVTIREFYGGLIIKTLKGYYIQHFDAQLNLKKEHTLEVKNNRIENAFVKDGQLHLLEFDSSRIKKTLIYNVLTSNLNNFNFITKELLSISEANSKKYFGMMVFPFFINNGFSQRDSDHLGKITMSKNNQFFAINFDIKNADKETHKVFVYNDNFELVYEKLIIKDIEDRLFKYNTIEVDDKDGTLYFLGKSYENNSTRKKKKGKTNYHFELSKIDKNGEKTVSFKNPDKFISSLSLVQNKGNLSCVGFYGNKDEGRLNGACLININAETLAIEAKKFNPFSATFLTDKYGDRTGKKKRKAKKGFTGMEFRSVEVQDDGGIVISAEEDYITVHTTIGQNGIMTTYTIQHYDDIISLKLSSQGDLLWSRNINKAQTGYNNSSFTPISVNNKMHYFINCSDNIKQLSNNRIHFRQSSSKKSNLYAITLDTNGDFEYKKLIDDKESKVFYKVNEGVITPSGNEVILLGKKKKSSRIIKIKI